MSYFVTGTDTNVGKTLISCALLHAFAARGKRVIGMKPVAAGCTEGAENEDVVQLRAASNIAATGNEINPYSFPDAVAPHLAAQNIHVSIDLSRIVKSFFSLSMQADIVIVEGVGGLRVPLNAVEDSADLAVQLDLPVILVAGMRLGCLNHALLTVEAIAARGLVLAGWVANIVDAKMPLPDENIAALQQRIAAPLLGVVPHLAQPDALAVSQRLDLELLERTEAHG